MEHGDRMNFNEIVVILLERYDVKSEESENRFRITSMIKAMREEYEDWPIDKSNRWIGFIQGALFAEGLLNIEDERHFTRPMFHAYYNAQGIAVPETIDVTTVGYVVDE